MTFIVRIYHLKFLMVKLTRTASGQSVTVNKNDTREVI